MRRCPLFFVLALAIGGALAPAQAQQPTDPVLAKVDGVEIRASELALAEADIGANLPAASAEERRDALLAYMIDVKLLTRAAEQKKLGEGPEFAKKLAYARSKLLMEGLLEQAAKGGGNEAEMKKLYDESITKMKPVPEVHARHILFRADPKDEKASKEAEAKARTAIQRLKKGEDFAALAKELSDDPSGKQDGGDLGFFTKDQMVPEFAEAAFKLDKGALSEPVKSQFGWHVIKVEEKRDRPVPTFDQVKDQIESFLARKAQAEMVMKLREAAKIEKFTSKPETPAAPGANPGQKKN